jgi:hypothetical protein
MFEKPVQSHFDAIWNDFAAWRNPTWVESAACDPNSIPAWCAASPIERTKAFFELNVAVRRLPLRATVPLIEGNYGID